MTEQNGGAERTVRFETAAQAASALADFAAQPPESLAGATVSVTATADGVATIAVGDADVRLESTDRAIRVDGTRRAAEAVGAVAAALADPDRRRFGAEPDVVDDPAITRRVAELLDGASSSPADDLRLAVRCTDLTTLEGDDTPGRIRALCAQAVRPDPCRADIGPVAAVCVYPALAGLVSDLLAGSEVRTASVAGAFPSGQSSLDVRLADIAAARAAGADEIDIVLNRRAVLSGESEQAQADIAASKVAADGAHLKVIIEVGELATAALIRNAAELAIAAGADTVKTSTGKISQNASLPAVLVIADVIREHHERTGHAVGLKVSGGVRTADDALDYIRLVRAVLGEEWLTPERFRFGASSLVDKLVAELNR